MVWSQHTISMRGAAQWDDVADLDVRCIYDHAVDEQLHERAAQLERGIVQPPRHGTRNSSRSGDEPFQLSFLHALGRQPLLLARQFGHLGLQPCPSGAQLIEGEDLGLVGIDQPLDLALHLGTALPAGRGSGPSARRRSTIPPGPAAPLLPGPSAPRAGHGGRPRPACPAGRSPLPGAARLSAPRIVSTSVALAAVVGVPPIVPDVQRQPAAAAAQQRGAGTRPACSESPIAGCASAEPWPGERRRPRRSPATATPIHSSDGRSRHDSPPLLFGSRPRVDDVAWPGPSASDCRSHALVRRVHEDLAHLDGLQYGRPVGVGIPGRSSAGRCRRASTRLRCTR